MTGDPRRAFALAGGLTEQPKMSHQARGLWGYTGTTAGGLSLTVQSTGVGAPSALAVLGDLAGLGVKRIVRLGTCIAPVDVHPQGQALLIDQAVALDGTSAGISGGSPSLAPDPLLLELLTGVAPLASVSSHDQVARHDPKGALPDPEATVRDLQTAITFAAGRHFEMKTAAVLVVAGDGENHNLPESELNELVLEVGRKVVNRLEGPET